MDAVTYPDEIVADYIDDTFIPLRMSSDIQPYADDFQVKWTPRIIILDPTGAVHQSNVGFFPPEEFIPSLELGLAKVDFNQDCLEECRQHLNRILSSHPQSFSAPEAVYLKGVVKYKTIGDAKFLKEAYYQLQERYPASEWAQRTWPYRLL